MGHQAGLTGHVRHWLLPWQVLGGDLQPTTLISPICSSRPQAMAQQYLLEAEARSKRVSQRDDSLSPAESEPRDRAEDCVGSSGGWPPL